MNRNEIVKGGFELLQDNWALVSVGNKKKHNAMTIAWGAFGALWKIPVAIIFIKKDRYSLELLDENKYFTLSFFSEKYKKDLIYLGTHSGRNEDKIGKTSLTPIFYEDYFEYEEAEDSYLCEKLFSQDLDKEMVPEEIYNTYYHNMETHRMYIARINTKEKKIP